MVNDVTLKKKTWSFYCVFLSLFYHLQFGANVNQANHRGNTPLHEAARWNFGQSVKLLIEVGHANPLIRNKAQLMPIQLAQVCANSVDLFIIFFILSWHSCEQYCIFLIHMFCSLERIFVILSVFEWHFYMCTSWIWWIAVIEMVWHVYFAYL